MKEQELKEERKRRASNLKLLRIRFEKCKIKFSEKSGLSRVTIDRIENGESVNYDSIIIYESLVNKLSN